MPLALGRGERGNRSGLEPTVFADIALLLATFVERVASLAWTIWMPLAKRRCEAVYRCRLVPTVFTVEVLHRRRCEQRDCGDTQCPREQKLHISLHCFSSFLSFLLLFRFAASRLNEKAASRACPVEATGMPKGITHETPPNLCRLQTTQNHPRRFRSQGTFVQLSCAVLPLDRTITSSHLDIQAATCIYAWRRKV